MIECVQIHNKCGVFSRIEVPFSISHIRSAGFSRATEKGLLEKNLLSKAFLYIKHSNVMTLQPSTKHKMAVLHATCVVEVHVDALRRGCFEIGAECLALVIHSGVEP